MFSQTKLPYDIRDSNGSDAYYEDESQELADSNEAFVPGILHGCPALSLSDARALLLHVLG